MGYTVHTGVLLGANDRVRTRPTDEGLKFSSFDAWVQQPEASTKTLIAGTSTNAKLFIWFSIEGNLKSVGFVEENSKFLRIY